MRKFADPWRAWRVRLVFSVAMAMAASLFVGASAVADNTGDNTGCTLTGTGQPCVVGAGTQLQFGFFPPPNGFAVFAVGTGPAAHGYFSFTSPFDTGGPNSDHQDINYVARVTCLVVVGNNAIATGIFTQPESSEGQRVVMQAVDNGGGEPPLDLLRFSFTPFIHPDLTTDPAGNCWRPVLPPEPIQTGHIAVGSLASENGDGGGGGGNGH